jgi:hypothetical protein
MTAQLPMTFPQELSDRIHSVSDYVYAWAQQQLMLYKDRVLHVNSAVCKFRNWTITDRSGTHVLTLDQQVVGNFPDQHTALLYCVLSSYNYHHVAQRLIDHSQRLVRLRSDLVVYRYRARHRSQETDHHRLSEITAQLSVTQQKLESTVRNALQVKLRSRVKPKS